MQSDGGYFVEIGSALENKLGITGSKELELREYSIIIIS